MKKMEVYCCEFCGKEFPTVEACEGHEATHIKTYENEENEVLSQQLEYLAEAGWGYHIGREVLGMPYENFHSLMLTAAKRLKNIINSRE